MRTRLVSICGATSRAWSRHTEFESVDLAAVEAAVLKYFSLLERHQEVCFRTNLEVTKSGLFPVGAAGKRITLRLPT